MTQLEVGTGFETAGDINGDGIPDVVAGAPSIDTAYVYSGRAGWSRIHGHHSGRVFLISSGVANPTHAPIGHEIAKPPPFFTPHELHYPHRSSRLFPWR